MFHLIWAIIIGFIVGLLARFFYPGAIHLGFWLTCALGIAGSVLGGFLGTLIKKPVPGSKFHTAGFFLSLICSILILFVCKQLGYL
jgi:uncharacterized membrane protein YeaQ/YmgE (transglycosylase-associated protein family)